MPSTKKSGQYSLHNQALLLKSGSDYFTALETLIDTAKYILHIQVYIFDADETGLRIKNCLINAAKRGVSVFILLDGFGSAALPDKFISDLTDAGIHFRWFRPLFSGKRLQIGRRMHHKVAVADANRSIVGGINIGNRYNHINNQPPWLDFALLTEGEIAFQLHAFCSKKWSGIMGIMRKKLLRKIRFSKPHFPAKKCMIRIRVNDQLNRKTSIVYSYRDGIRRAKENVTIVGAYFLPGSRFLKLLKAASLRGVKITLLTGAESDVWLAENAIRFLYRRLLRNNIQIFEYTKATVHGKVMICDGEFVTMGSYDLNQLSTFINVELNLDVLDKDFGSQFQLVLDNIIKTDCLPITSEILNRRENAFLMFKQWLAYRLLRIMFIITLFVSGKRDY